MTDQSNQPAPREWTIKFFEDTHNYYEDIQGPNTGKTPHGIEAIRVIEKSAYEKLQCELEIKYAMTDKLTKERDACVKAYNENIETLKTFQELMTKSANEIKNLKQECADLRFKHNVYNPCSMHAHIRAKDIESERDILRSCLNMAREALEAICNKNFLADRAWAISRASETLVQLKNKWPEIFK